MPETLALSAKVAILDSEYETILNTSGEDEDKSERLSLEATVRGYGGNVVRQLTEFIYDSK